MIVFQQLISKISFGWTVRVLGLVMGCTYLLLFPLLLWGVSNLGDLASGSPRKLFDCGALRDRPFELFSVSNLLVYMVPFQFLPSYGRLELGVSQDFSLYVSMVSQASSIVGRFFAGYLASRIVAMAWYGASTTAGFVVIASLCDCFSGAIIPLPVPNTCD
jgi:hypothetical protein